MLTVGTIIYIILGLVVINVIARLLYRVLFTILAFCGLYWAYYHQGQIVQFAENLLRHLRA